MVANPILNPGFADTGATEMPDEGGTRQNQRRKPAIDPARLVKVLPANLRLRQLNCSLMINGTGAVAEANQAENRRAATFLRKKWTGT